MEVPEGEDREVKENIRTLHGQEQRSPPFSKMDFHLNSLRMHRVVGTDRKSVV